MTKKYNIISLIILLIFSTLIQYSCKNNSENTDSEKTDTVDTKNNEIVITKEQFKTSGMKLGTTVPHSFENKINVTGLITVSPQGKAIINTPIAGYIKFNPVTTGQYVKKGQVLLTIESNEIIQLQQEYAENINLLTALETDYNRQKKLFEEKITSEKDFITVESNYKSLKAKCSGLYARLKFINIDPNETENGTINSKIALFSPINGYITVQNSILGQFAEPQSNLIEIIDINKLYLKLFVFEKDINALNSGNTVEFYIPGKISSKFKAKLITVGKSVNPETKTIECIAQLETKDIHLFAEGTYTEASIITEKKQANAIPNNALIKSEENDFVLVKTEENETEYKFLKQKVDLGIKSEDFSEIITNINQEILTEGAYNINF